MKLISILLTAATIVTAQIKAKSWHLSNQAPCTVCLADDPENCISMRESSEIYISGIRADSLLAKGVLLKFEIDDRVIPKRCVLYGDSIYARIDTMSSTSLQALREAALKTARDSFPIPKSELMRMSKNGIAILAANPYDESDAIDGTGAEFKFFNPTQKTVKYITIKAQGINAVGDPVPNLMGSTTVQFRFVGPIYPHKIASYEHSFAWHNDLPETLKILSINVEYMDKTKKSIPVKSAWATQTTIDFLDENTTDDEE